RVADKIAVAAERFRGIEAAIINWLFNDEREVPRDRFGIIVPQAPNGTCGTRQQGPQGPATISSRHGLGVNERGLRRLVRDPRRDLPTGIAVDARRIDEEIPWNVFSNALRQIRHNRSAVPPRLHSSAERLGGNGQRAAGVAKVAARPHTVASSTVI